MEQGANFETRCCLPGITTTDKQSLLLQAVYEYLEDGKHDCESTIGLYAASEAEFEDDGHAIAWAMQQ